MLEARDAKGHPITAQYDMLGRRTALESMDLCRQEFAYDERSDYLGRMQYIVYSDDEKMNVKVVENCSRESLMPII